MKITYSLLFLTSLSFLFCSTTYSQSIKVSGPMGSEKFGYNVKVLDNGNYVVVDPNYDNGSAVDVGAVFLYHGFTHNLISKLTGSSANDRVGIDGVTMISGNKFVVRSSVWDKGGVVDAGAVTIVDGTTGLSGEVSIANSLIGSSSSDNVGLREIIDLKNGNYLIHSPLWSNGSALKAGSVTWFSANNGIVGEISATNSLVGTHTEDYLGTNLGVDLITVLANGNYVVASPFWDSGSTANVGAVTLCSGSSGRSDVVSGLNSITGSSWNDKVGISGIVKLTNGNFVIKSYFWNNDSASEAGAVTWVNATGDLMGTVSPHNSLVGTSYLDHVGVDCAALTNGNYIVISPQWNSNTASDVGAVTWANGSLGGTGVVSSANSLIGAKSDDQVGGFGILLALTNGNFVVGSPKWDNGDVVNAGAVTWGDGATGIVGVVSSSNSLVGSSESDEVGIGGMNRGIALSNGNYVVSSSTWNNGSIVDAGFVAWGNGTAVLAGGISNANALVGSSVDDKVGEGGVFALDNGSYVVNSHHWNNGAATWAGAVTWAAGSVGIIGTISSANSLVGSQANDLVGNNGITILPNGNYLVCTGAWDNGTTQDVGAVTWGAKGAGVKGEITPSNSLVGSSSGDRVGSFVPVSLSNGDYLIVSIGWSSSTAGNVGAVAQIKGDASITGYINEKDKITGLTSGDYVGYGGIQAFPNGGLLIKSPYWNSGSISDAGALTWSSGATPLSGIVNECNSIVGHVPNGIEFATRSVYNPKYNYVLVGVKNENALVVFDPTDVTLPVGQNEVEVDLIRAGTTALVDKANCSLIANLSSTGGQPVLGTVEAKVWVEEGIPTYSGTPYVARHAQIAPESNSSIATGTITLYFTQQEFDEFNVDAGSTLNLPANPNDATGKGNLRIGKFSGKSSDGSGLPETYPTGGATVINPDDDKIVWNPNLLRWEVTFSVVGFSGFIVNSNNNALPVKLISFVGKASESNTLLNWEIAEVINFSHFEVERSLDGKSFVTVGQIPNADDQFIFNYVDKGALIFGEQLYYRLKMIDVDGSYAYSKKVVVNFKHVQLKAFPNPFLHAIHLSIQEKDGEIAVAKIYAQNGTVVFNQTKQINGEILHLDISNNQMPAGVYILSVQAGRATYFQRIVKAEEK